MYFESGNIAVVILKLVGATFTPTANTCKLPYSITIRNIRTEIFVLELDSALGNAEAMNDDSNIACPQINGNPENNIGGNSFTGLGEQKQMDDNGAMDTPGLSSMANQEPQQSEVMGGGQASVEGQQG